MPHGHRPLPDFGRRRRAAGTLALCLAGGLAVGAARAQEAAPSPLDPTLGAVGAAGPSGFGPADDTGGLRGTAGFEAGDAAAPGNGLPVGAGETGETAADGAQDEPRQRPPFQLRSTIRPVETSTAKARSGPPHLPDLVPYPRAVRPLRPGETPADPMLQPATPAPVSPTIAVLPVPPAPRRAPVDPAPFAPLGFDIGTLRFTPFIEQSFGYDSNPDQTSSGVKGSAFSRTEGGFDLLSLWSSNELRATMHGGYDDFFSNPGANRPDGAGTVDYRYDVSRDINLNAEGRFAISTQRPGSPELDAAVTDRPLITSYGVTLGGNDTLGRFTFGLHGLFDRTEYENGHLSGGGVVLLDDQTYNDYGVNARVDYELLPTIKPFVDLTVDTRIHDRHLDYNGYARDSDGVLGRVGSTFAIGPLITGTFSAGYEDRSYEDRRLKDLQGPVFDGSLAYAVTPLTTVTLNANTSFNETNVVGSSGSESRTVSLSVSHALLRNVTLTATGSYLNTDYSGTGIVENTYSGTLRASYALSRSIVLDATYNHQTLKSTAPANNYTQDVVMVGVRLQH